MGSGKSYWSKKMAKELGYESLDLDTMIERKEQKSISQIFEQEGEPAFRELEQYCLQQSCKITNDIIIALGGGTPCFFDNIEWINRHGVSIFLDFSVDFLIQNLRSEIDKRPLLKGKSIKEMEDFIQQKLQERYSFYSQAQYCIKNPASAATDLMTIINNKTPL